MRTTLPLFCALALVAALTGCEKVTVNSRSTSSASTNPVGPEAVLVESPEAKERRLLRAEAIQLLNAGNYDKIDRRADALRASGDIYPDGNSKLNEFCFALSNLPELASEARWSNTVAHLQSWVKAKPQSITAHIALGRALIGYGCKARGGVAGGEVSKIGLMVHRQRLTEAREVLMQGQKIKTSCPLLYPAMLQLVLEEGASRDFIDQVFAAAVRADPNSALPYFIRAAHLSQGSLGNKGELLQQFVQTEADKLGDDAGDMLYARIVWSVQGGVTNIFDETKLSWLRTKKGFQALQKAFPDSLLVKSEFCYLAGLAGDRPQMKELFTQIQGNVDPAIWKEKKRFLKDRQWAFAN